MIGVQNQPVKFTETGSKKSKQTGYGDDDL